VLFFLIVSVSSLFIFGINFGIDFKGGTLYQVELQKQVSTEEIVRIDNTIKQRIDPGGLRGDISSPVGGQYIIIKTSETNPEELEKIESRIRQQGKFEATLNGEIVFTGDQIKKVLRGDNSYSVAPLGKTAYEWRMPFVLSEDAVQSFKEKSFHQCTATGVSSNGQTNYECERTIFFLDRPNALIVVSQEQYEKDIELFNAGNRLENIPQETDIEEIITDSMNKVIVLDGNSFDESIAEKDLNRTNIAVVSPDVSEKIIDDLNSLGFSVSVVAIKENVPWIWTALGAKQVISLTPGITNEDVSDISQAKSFSTLFITGQRDSLKEAKSDLEELTILLESGSLPTPVKTISKETISPALGEAFLQNIILMGFIALIIVAGVIIFRYKNLWLALPIFATIISETVILLGLLSLPFPRQSFDLAAFAGIIAALGSGVNAEIVIVDELTEKTKREELSLIQRIKSGLFIITTSAITIIGVMGPIVLFSRSMPGLSNLYGFAIVAILGALIGVLITRPAFTKIIETIIDKKENEERKN
jgi:preprotein translocase subunit SecD